MKKSIFFIPLILSLLACNPGGYLSERQLADIADLTAKQCLILDRATPDTLMPRNFKDGQLVTTTGQIRGYWIIGFFPGTCWYSYLLSGDEEVKQAAVRRTALLNDPDYFYTNHDIGFEVMCSSGMAWQATGDSSYLPIIRRGAELLASRFSPVTGTIESWASTNDEWKVIIDNMMNLELLTFASRQFEVPEWKEIAVKHAETTLKNHFREDASSYHMVVYNRNDGSVLRKQTVQGYADESAWSRGQAWALYGYTMMYRETANKAFLDQAEKVAAFLLPRLEKRPVPCWDFDAPKETEGIDDSSAASVMASAFIELSGLTFDNVKSETYLRMAKSILAELSSRKYLAGEGELSGFILKHGTGHLPKGSEIDVPLSYGDYYYLEALYRLKNIL